LDTSLLLLFIGFLNHHYHFQYWCHLIHQ